MSLKSELHRLIDRLERDDEALALDYLH